jgi:pyruvate-formate lyase
VLLGVAEKEFIAACITSLKGVRNYLLNYAALARHLAKTHPEKRNPREYPFTDAQRENLIRIADRMDSLATKKPQSFVDAAQLVFTVHCCLHLTGDPTSIGRLDQLLEPFLGATPEDEAQEIIDCFFVKMGERVQVNKTKLVDRNTWGTCAVPYRSDGLFPNGDSINQWVQQLTVGGYKNTETGKVSACNKVTMMCLKSARRLPLNAPCVSLRVHHNIGQEYLEEAGKAMLSGGAHPIILHDDRLIEGLTDVMTEFKTNFSEDDRNALTNIACDGCYEPLVAGSTEFAFTYLPLLQVLEMTINEGATYSSAGPAYLNGTPQSLPTKSAADIDTFEEVKEIFK